MTDSRSSKAATDGAASLASAELAAQYWQAKAKSYEEVHDRSPDGMMIFRAVRDAAGRIVDFEWLYCNASASQIVGRRSEDLLGKNLLVEMPGNKADGLFDIYVRVVDSGEPYSHEFSYRHEGLDNWFRSTSIKLGDGFYVAFSDLTVRKRSEEQAARLAAIIRSSEHAIYSTSNVGVVETWNHGAETLYGYTSAEILGESILVTIPEQCRSEYDDALRRILERGGLESFHSTRTTKAGALVHVSLMLSAIRDLERRTVGIAVIASDLSEQMKLQERLVVSDRMASVGTLAAGMAHEINNPLAFVTANLDLVIEEVRVFAGGSPSGRLKELEGMAVDARQGAERIRKIVRGLMTFSRADEERRTVIDVKRVLELAVNMAFNEIRHRARLVKEYGAIPLVVADDARLGQVFINLLVNAAQAIGDGDVEANEIRIVTSTVGERAVIEIRDTGPGMSATVLGRIFDPFFTTKPVGVGTGLGLSICRNIVTRMDGEITATNNDDRGTTFRVVLPAAAASRSESRLAPRVEAGTSRRRGAVLVVDDEPMVGSSLTRVLREHDVTVVTNARQALALLGSGEQFDVIISDIMMPEMSGMEFYEELVRQNSSAAERVVFITGGVFTAGAREFLERVPNERMDKPFETKLVRELVRRFVKE
jgi:PAS domain S-box-containing protein